MRYLSYFAAIAMAAAGCSRSASSEAMLAEPATEASYGDLSGLAMDMEEQEAPAAPRYRRAARDKKTKASVSMLRAENRRGRGAPAPEAESPAEMDDSDGIEAPTRSWFPETFLFAPMVPTDARGQGQVALTVPDRLTTWRVLALAHDRLGGRGGTVTTFDSSLPAYVDPVVPDGLIAGDKVALPVLAVNTTDQKMTRTLSVEVKGGSMNRVSVPVVIGPRQSVVRYIPVEADRPGRLSLTYALGGADKVIKHIPVRSPGRPVQKNRAGALTDAVAFRWPLPADTRADSVSVGLTVYPGALALVRSELSSAPLRTGLADTAYALQLAGRAPKLLSRLGGKTDPNALRKSRLRASQRILRASRSPTASQKLLIAHGVGPHAEDSLLGRLGDRMSIEVSNLQRPDGTFTGGNGWTLQRVLVTTAAGLRALAAVADDEASRRRLRGARIRAEGAFERYIDTVKDPYTASAILAAQGVRGALAERLQAKVLEALKGTEVGLTVGRGVVNAVGRRPSTVEASAMAVLALANVPAGGAALSALGTTLLGAYGEAAGWGDGYGNLVALDAVTALFSEPLPDRVDVTLYNGDQAVAKALLAGPTRTERHEVRVRVPAAVRESRWRITASPAVPGLAYALRVDYHVPWSPAPEAGVTLKVNKGKKAKVGEPLTVSLVSDAPHGAPVSILYALPAGVQPMRADLQRLEAAKKIAKWRLDAGGIEIEVPRRAPGTPAQLEFRVVPGFSGQLQAMASQVAMTGRPGTRI
ncbi:MAG: alpha-2-macroglobulin family protein, partial [Myxococcota bacterium]